jgi:drug/metabolite transporter (DMT)-like permease
LNQVQRAEPKSSATLTGIACGAGAAVFWAFGLVAARHGIDAGLMPWDLTVHRFWGGIVLLPLVLRDGIADLNGIGWRRGIALTVLGGPGLALISYSGFLLVPLGHGGVIQPSCAALGGLLLAALVLREKIPAIHVVGAAIIVLGLLVIGGEAIATIGAHGLLGDLTFVLAGLFFATFGTLLRLWRIPPMRGTAVISVLSLALFPLYAALFGFDRLIAAGFQENLMQSLVQGIMAGPGAIYLFTRSVVLLGAARAAVFPSLVPGFTLLIGFLALGEIPTWAQIAGFAIVLLGFRLTQKS